MFIGDFVDTLKDCILSSSKQDLDCIKFREFIDDGEIDALKEFYEEKKEDIKLLTSMNHNAYLPIHIAAEYGYDEITEFLVKEMIKFNLKFDEVSRYGRTPLYLACMCGHKGESEGDSRYLTIQCLLKVGANPNAVDDKSRMSCLHWACYYPDDFNSIKSLLEFGADLFVYDKQNISPLFILGLTSGGGVETHEKRQELFNYVLDHVERYLDSDKGNLEKNSHTIPEYITPDDRKGKKLIMSNLKSYSRKELILQEAMYWAVVFDKQRLFEKLLAAYISPFLTVNMKDCVLIGAIKEGADKYVELMLDMEYVSIDNINFDAKKEVLNITDQENNNLLHIAALWDRPEIFNAIEKRFPQGMQIRNLRGYLPLDYNNFREDSQSEPCHLLVLAKENEESCNIKKTLHKKRFKVSEQDSLDSKHKFLLLTLDRSDYKEYAFAFNLKALNKVNNSLIVYKRENANECYPLTNTQKNYIMKRIMRTGVNIKNYIRNGIVTDVLPLHDSFRKDVLETWQNYYFSLLFNLMIIAKIGALTPVYMMASYFSEETALYFLWMSFYTSWLLYLAVPALPMSIIQASNQIFDYNLIPLFTAIVSIWITVMHSNWKKYEDTIVRSWHVDHFMQLTTREDFRFVPFFDKYRENTLTLPEKHTKSKLMIFRGSLILFGVAASAVVFFGFRLWLSQVKGYFYIIIVGVVHGFAITIMDMVYLKLSMWLTNLESLQYQFEWLQSHSTKLFWFRMVNSYLLLFVVAYYDCDIETLGFLCASIFITREILFKFIDFIIPWAIYKFRTYKLKVSPEQKRKITETARAMRVQTEAARGLSEEEYNSNKNEYERIKAEKNYNKLNPMDITASYSKMVIQLGYILFFSNALPIIPFAAFIFNLFEIRQNIKLFIKILRRPKAEFVYDIGVWNSFIDFFILVSPIMNCCTMYFTSDEYDKSVRAIFGVTREIDIIYNMVVFEHILIVTSWITNYLVGQLPPENLANEKEAIRSRSKKEGVAPYIKLMNEYDRVKKLLGRNGTPGKEAIPGNDRISYPNINAIKVDANSTKEICTQMNCIKFLELAGEGKLDAMIDLYESKGRSKKLLIYKDYHHRMPIHVAANFAYPKIVQFLLQEMKYHNIPFDVPCANYNSPLHTACCNFQSLGQDISNNKQVKDPNGNDTVLERDLKLINGTKVIMYLIEAGSDVNVKNSKSLMNCLHWICCNVKTDWPLITLLNKSADFLALDCQNMTPIDYLALQHRVDAYETLDYVLTFIEEQKVDLMITDYQKKCDLTRTGRNRVIEGNVMVVYTDLSNYSKEHMSWLSIMYWTAFRGRKTLFKKLLKFELSPFVNKYQEGSALTAAIKSRNESVVEYILNFKYEALDRKLDYDVVKNGVLSRDKYGNTPLHIAAMMGEKSLYKRVEVLYDNNQIQNSRGFSPEGLMRNCELIKEEDIKVGRTLARRRGMVKANTAEIERLCNGPSEKKENIVIKELKEPEYMVVIRKENDGAIDLDEQFKMAKLEIKNYYSFDSKFKLTTLTVPERSYRNKAEILELEAICTGWEVSDRYSGKEYNAFYPFKVMQRHTMILNMIEDELDMDNYMHYDVIASHFPLHTRARETVANTLRTYYWSQLYIMATSGKTKKLVPILTLAAYFGEKIGIYYAWLTFYTAWLFYISIPGIIVTIFQIKNNSLDHFLVPAYCIILSLWITLMNEKWKWREAKLIKVWNLDDVKDVQVERSEFRGMEVYDRKMKKIIKTTYINTEARVWLFTVSLGISGILMIGSAFIAIRIWASANQNIESQIIVNIVNCLAIIVLNSFYTWLSSFLANIENHRYQADWEDSYILKTYALQFGNSYAGLFAIAFYDYNLTNLAFTLGVILTVKQFIADIMEFFFPWFLSKLSLCWFKRKYIEATDSEKDGYDFKEQHILADPPTVIDGYSEMIIQLGYLSMFSNSLPIAPFFALINNLLEIKGEISLRLNTYRRPIAHSVKTIGAWKSIMDFLATVSTMVNCFAIYLLNTEYSHMMSNLLSVNEQNDQLYFILVFEHFLIFMKWLVTTLFKRKEIAEISKRGPIYRKMLNERGWNKAVNQMLVRHKSSTDASRVYMPEIKKKDDAEKNSEEDKDSSESHHSSPSCGTIREIAIADVEEQKSETSESEESSRKEIPMDSLMRSVDHLDLEEDTKIHAGKIKVKIL